MKAPAHAPWAAPSAGGCIIRSTALADGLDALGSKLILRRGEPLATIRELISETGARTVLWNRRYAPEQMKLDTAIKRALRDSGIAVESFEGRIMHEPTQLKTGSGGPYRVYTPFWRAFQRNADPRPPAGSPENIVAFDGDVASDRLEDWSLLPVNRTGRMDCATNGHPAKMGRSNASTNSSKTRSPATRANRDIPSIRGTSKLSPHLAFGEISPFQIWDAMESYRDRYAVGRLHDVPQGTGLARIFLSPAGEFPRPEDATTTMTISTPSRGRIQTRTSRPGRRA